MADHELSRALACLALLCIDQKIFENESLFSLYCSKCPFEVWCQPVLYKIKYFSDCFSVSRSVLFKKNSFRSSMSVSSLLILCVYTPFLLLPSCLKNI